MSGPPEAQLIHTLSRFHCLIRELYLTNHHSSQEHATYGTSCLLLVFLNPTTCHLSNLRSINLILSLSPLSFHLFLSSIVGALYRSPWPFHNIIYQRKEKKPGTITRIASVRRETYQTTSQFNGCLWYVSEINPSESSHRLLD